MTEIQTLDEYQAWLEARRAQGGNGKETPSDTIRLALQGAVLAENLTGDKHWDYYLQCLQGEVEDAKGRSADYLERLASSHLVDQDSIMRLKLAIAAVSAQIEALEWAIALPRAIKETGKEAKALNAEPAPSAA